MKTINNAKYQGYIWYSDQSHPEVLDGNSERELELDENANPYIVEANLWDNANRKSISIRYIDGKYYTNEKTVEEDELSGDTDHSTRKCYIAHRIDGYRYLHFIQYWKTRKDTLCADMEVLEPERLVFIGLSNNESQC